jgi:hypothetical protein
VLIMMMLTTMTAWADTETVSYIDADGNEQTVTATVLTGDVTADCLSTDAYGDILIPAGWYVVKNSKDGVDASYTATLSYTGDNGTIHLILADGAEMTVSESTTDAIDLDDHHPLAIYGQSGSTGRLTVTGYSKAIDALGGITINGGIVNATATDTDFNAHAIYADDKFTINGGQVTATTAGSGKGIYVYNAALTIGCRKASDFITANGYHGKVNIKSGQTLYAGATAYSGNNISLPSGTVTLRPYSSDDFSVNDAGTEYTIHTAKGWNVFCDCLQDNDSWNRFSGKTVRLGADITVTRMAGSSKHDFCGTFDGGGHTLTFNYGTSDSYASDEYTAPFCYVSTDTPSGGSEVPTNFRNLHVSGDIYTTAKYAAGLIARQWGTVNVENCRSSIVVHSNVTNDQNGGNDGTHGGFVSVQQNGTLSFTGCTFDGKLLTNANNVTTRCGGFVGYRSGGTSNVTNCLYAPAALANGETEVVDGNSATFVRNGAPTVTNSYYTRALGTPQGKAVRNITAGENVTVGHAGDATHYATSGITAYKATGASADSDPFIAGLLYNNVVDVLYAGSGDAVSLTLSNTAPDAPDGYQYDGYTASAGTLSGSTLTMPDEDVTISVNTAALTAIPWDGDGSEGKPYIIEYPSQLDLLAHRVNGTHGQTRQADGFKDKYFKLGADIEYDPSELIFDNDGNRKCVYGLQGFPRRLVHPQRRAARRQAHEERDLHE